MAEANELRKQLLAAGRYMLANELTWGNADALVKTVQMIADRTGGDTVLARMIELVAAAQRSRAPMQKLADRVPQRCERVSPAEKTAHAAGREGLTEQLARTCAWPTDRRQWSKPPRRSRERSGGRVR